MNQETRVGLFLLVSIFVIAVSALFLGNIHLFKRTARFYIFFNNAEALPPKAAAKIAGVEVGKVTRVELIEGRARVTIDIDPKIPIYKDAQAKVGSTGIIGTKFIDLNPGTVNQPRLESGASIQGSEGGGLEAIADKLSRLFEKSDKYGDAIENLQASIANIRHVTDALNVAMGNHAKEMEDIVMNVKDLTASAKAFTADLQEISAARKDDVKVALEKFRSIGERLDAILAKVQEGKGAIGTLVSDDQTGKDVKEAVASIKDTAASAKKVLGRFTQINTYWDFRYRYDTRDEEGRSDASIRIEPKPGKFYAFGATNIGDPISDEKHQAYERKNRIVAVMGHDYGPFTGYAGVIRSRAGAGLNFRPLWKMAKLKDRFELNAEMYDFSRDRTVQGKRIKGSNLDLGAHVAVTRWLWVGARVEDVLERSAFMAYTNIVFRDEDLAYLLGFATIAGGH
jgi:phospholipid/cholesterol/gamma-HCH transport system substrate-binding protein